MSYNSFVKSINNSKVIVVFDSFVKDNIVVPLFCPICSFQMKTLQDSFSYREKGSCEKCQIYWGYKNELKDDLKANHPKEFFPEQWEEYIKERELQARPILIFK